jgi:sodium-dependent dicarboxylate transporter 2/3/5
MVFAAAMEHWRLHTKIALKFLLLVGARPKLIMLGFMLITAFISMWISNTGTTAMLVCTSLAPSSLLPAPCSLLLVK